MSTFEFSATIPAALDVASRGQTVTLDLAALPKEVLAQALVHGLTQKIGDAAASALIDAFSAAHDEQTVKASTPAQRKAWGEANPDAVAAHARAALEKAVHNLKEHGWTARTGGGTSLDPMDKFRAEVVREIITRDKSSAVFKKYDAIDSSDQKARREFLLAIAAKNAEKVDPVAKARLDAARKPKGVALDM